jgi:hypothetical protein
MIDSTRSGICDHCKSRALDSGGEATALSICRRLHPRNLTLTVLGHIARSLLRVLGDYVLLLIGKRLDGGFEGVADYSFRLVRK